VEVEAKSIAEDYGMVNSAC